MWCSFTITFRHKIDTDILQIWNILPYYYPNRAQIYTNISIFVCIPTLQMKMTTSLNSHRWSHVPPLHKDDNALLRVGLGDRFITVNSNAYIFCFIDAMQPVSIVSCVNNMNSPPPNHYHHWEIPCSINNSRSLLSCCKQFSVQCDLYPRKINYLADAVAKSACLFESWEMSDTPGQVLDFIGIRLW